MINIFFLNKLISLGSKIILIIKLLIVRILIVTLYKWNLLSISWELPNIWVTYFGEMAEWFKAHAWKACKGEALSWVRIPFSPPYIS